MCLTKEKSFYREFFNLYVPLVLYNIVLFGVNLADNVMIGAYSETALSGVAAVNQIQFVFQQVIVSAGDAVVVLGSQYWGAKMKSNTSRAVPYMWAPVWGCFCSWRQLVSRCNCFAYSPLHLKSLRRVRPIWTLSNIHTCFLHSRIFSWPICVVRKRCVSDFISR